MTQTWMNSAIGTVVSGYVSPRPVKVALAQPALLALRATMALPELLAQPDLPDLLALPGPMVHPVLPARQARMVRTDCQVPLGLQGLEARHRH